MDLFLSDTDAYFNQTVLATRWFRIWHEFFPSWEKSKEPYTKFQAALEIKNTLSVTLSSVSVLRRLFYSVIQKFLSTFLTKQ